MESLLGGQADDTSHAYRLQTALHGSGNVLQVWDQSDDTRFNILSNWFDWFIFLEPAQKT